MISIQILVFCGVFMEGAKWITRCRLNKIKDSWKLSGCLLTQKKEGHEIDSELNLLF